MLYHQFDKFQSQLNDETVGIPFQSDGTSNIFNDAVVPTAAHINETNEFEGGVTLDRNPVFGTTTD